VKISIPKHFREQARTAIDAALIKYPDLNRNGLGGEHHEVLDVDSVATALAFLQCGPVRKSRIESARRDSASLKLDAERWGRLIGFADYVGNGDLIAAVTLLGIPTRRIDDSLNVAVGLVILESTSAGMGCLPSVTARIRR
jgi:hypothetical protein